MGLMFAGGPPIESGYRGSRRVATLEDFYGPTEQKTRNRNNEKGSAKVHGGTKHAATNLSYLKQRIPEHYANRSNSNNGNRSHRNKSKSAHDRHARRGSRRSESEVTHRFRAQSKQFDTGTKDFIKRTCPSASELIAGIQEKVPTNSMRAKNSQLAETAFQIAQHEPTARNQISCQIDDF